MGNNTSKKLAAQCTLLTKDEQKFVAATFKAASKNSDKIKEDDLIVSGTIDFESLDKFWGPQIDPRLAQYLSNFLFGWGNNKVQSVDFNRFAELYVYNVRGSTEERLRVIYSSLGTNYGDNVELPIQLLKEYCESLASTCIKILKSSGHRRAKAWISKGFRGRPQHVQALGEAIASTAGGDEAHQVSSSQVSRWIYQNSLLQHLQELVFVDLYGIDQQRPGDDSPTSSGFSAQPLPLLPSLEGLSSMPDYPAFTDLSHIVWLNSQLPRSKQNKWRFLFSSHIHGDSFSTMAARILDEGSSVLIIEDKSGYIFGGYATTSWAISPTWTGTEEAFLFTLAPKMRAYHSSGFNDHYQYLNHHTKTLPNGLLMGGQFEFGGIWICADPFGTGSSAESCSTFRGYNRLSKEQNFGIRSLEVWGVGDKPLSMKESGERDISALDKDPEARAMLDMAGHKQHSEGLREPDQRE